MILSIIRAARTWVRPVLVALLNPSISWSHRWRLLLLQPILFLTYSIHKVPYIFSRPFVVEYLPIGPNGSHVRVLVFKSKDSEFSTGRKLRPLHVDIHGGAFIGGLAENFAPFDNRIARETGAVVVSITYRFAPEHTFPAAIDDVDRTLEWLREHAESRWGADPTLMTISGSSAGGSLALAATQRPECHGSAPTALKAAITFYAVVDQRISPWQKPRPEKMPSPNSDPMRLLMPLFDSYPSEARKDHLDDPRLSPVLAKRETMPDRMLMVIPLVDILVAEQMDFIQSMREQHVRSGRNSDGDQDWLQVVKEEEGFHGYLELPELVIPQDVKARAFDPAIALLKDVYVKHGWDYEMLSRMRVSKM